MHPLLITGIAIIVTLVLLYTAFGLYNKSVREEQERKQKFAEMFNQANPIK
jgi:hypothetical protein